MFRYPTAAAKNPYNDSMSRKLRRWRSADDEKENNTVKIIDLRGFDEFLKENRHMLDYHIRYDHELVDCKLSYEVVKVGEKEHMILYDENFVQTVRDSIRWFMDATFSVVPKLKGVKQFLTIMAEKYGKVSFFGHIVAVIEALRIYKYTNYV